MNEAQHLDIIQAPAEIQSELDRYLAAIESSE
jgi:hypothetical protein